MPMPTPSADLQQVVKRLLATPAQIRKAQQRTMKKVAKQMTTRVSAVIRAQLPLRKKYVDDRLLVRFYMQGETSQVIISSSRSGLLLTRFPYSILKANKRNPWGRGINVQTKTGSSRTRLKHAFTIVLQGGNLGIVERVGGKGSARTPLNVLHGKSISQAFAAKLPELKRESLDLLTKIQQQELRFALNLETAA